ncbi:MAG: patatin-like phospholipase family protein [Anaerolineales bacterium]
MSLKNSGREKKKLGLALSGGGARGIAHIGVLKALEKADIEVDFLSGTSMGGLVAAAYASGLSSVEIEEVSKEYGKLRNLWRLADPTLPRQSVFLGKRLETFFEEILKVDLFEDLRIPLTLIAVDLNSGKEVHFNSGPVAHAVRATVAVPGLLAPVEEQGQCLVDGGLLNNLPTDAAREMGADVVLAVDVFAGSDGDASYWHYLSEKKLVGNTVGGLVRILGDSLNLVIYHQSLHKLNESPPDYLIRPKVPANVNVFSGYDQAAELIQEGIDATLPILDDLREALETKSDK